MAVGFGCKSVRTNFDTSMRGGVIERCGKLSCFDQTSPSVRTPKFGIDGARLEGLDYVRVCARLCRIGTAGLLFQVGDSSR